MISLGCDCLLDGFQVILLFIPMALPRMPAISPLVSKPAKYALCTVWVALYPLICILQEVHNMVHERREGYIRTEPIPRSISPKFGRRRTLSTGGQRFRRATERCALLDLPPEIRDMIWREAMGEILVHLWVRDGKLGGTKCIPLNRVCQGEFSDSILKVYRGHGVLAVLSSCKQMSE
jgi:hypothetical protein